MCIYTLTVSYSLSKDVEIFDCNHMGCLFIKVLDVHDIFYHVKSVVMSQVSLNTFEKSDYELCHVHPSVHIEQLGSHCMHFHKI